MVIQIFDHEIEHDKQNQIPIQSIPLQECQNRITERRYPIRNRKKTGIMELTDKN